MFGRFCLCLYKLLAAVNILLIATISSNVKELLKILKSKRDILVLIYVKCSLMVLSIKCNIL